jgi:hypothetical protein
MSAKGRGCSEVVVVFRVVVVLKIVVARKIVIVLRVVVARSAFCDEAIHPP